MSNDLTAYVFFSLYGFLSSFLQFGGYFFYFSSLIISNIFLTLFLRFRSNLVRLKERINELHVEIDAAKEDFRHLHRERGLLTRERDLQKVDIETWSARCKELQMLKFGREIDLDELEANSDQTKEKEAEEVLQNDAEKFKAKSAKLFKTSARLEEELALVSFSFCFFF